MTYRKDYYEKNKERILAKYKEYYEKHKEKRLAYMKSYHIANREQALKDQKEYWQKNKAKIQAKQREYYNKNRADQLEKKRKYHQETYPKIKNDVLTYYGNGKLACVCCGENILQFLNIDHINNDGSIHRKQTGNKKIYLWLKANNYPIGFQTLCSNCNHGKLMNKGICPHRLLKKTLPIEVVWSN